MNYSTVKITNKTANQLQVQKNVNRKRETVRDGAEFKKDITKKKRMKEEKKERKKTSKNSKPRNNKLIKKYYEKDDK